MQALMSTDISSRKYLDGKRKCASESKFRLLSNPVVKLQGHTRSEVNAMFTVSLESLENSMFVDRLSKAYQGMPRTGADVEVKKKGVQFLTEDKTTHDRVQSILDESHQQSARALIMSQVHDDLSLTDWQDFSTTAARAIKAGEQNTFPVLVRGTGEKSNQKRTKRWGNGQMETLAPKSESEGIDGPSSYLEVFKQSRRRYEISAAKLMKPTALQSF